jgi:hypothetical protein
VNGEVSGPFFRIRPVGPHTLRVPAKVIAEGQGLRGGQPMAVLDPEAGLHLLDRGPVTVHEGPDVSAVHPLIITPAAKAVSDYTVVAFPEESNRWKEKSRFMAQVRPDQSGWFTVRALPPGGYFVVAVEYLDEGDAYDPELLEKLRPRATAVTLKDTSPQTLTLKVVVQ